MSGQPQGGQYDNSYGHDGQGYYHDDQQGYYDNQNGQHGQYDAHGQEPYYDEQ
jgi:1,3-beta-glucan synthase